MDFLRTSGQENTRERKSWGSLDRSWARRARGQTRRGDLLNADFSGDRERPSSPSPLAESKPFLQEEEAKPGKAWRQKIEAWLSENEKEDRAGEELQRKARQLRQANRRSFEDSESEGKNSIRNTLAEDDSMHEGFSEVYDWRPSVEKTDVMRTMEAIEEAQPNQSQKDKSPWRKSSLNVPNSIEETDPRYSRRLRSRLSAENVLAPSPLQAIREEDRKKNKISDVVNANTQDELTIYLRQPYNASPVTPATPRRFSKLGKKSTEDQESRENVSDKIEIDSDNIETPPATRRLISPPKEVKPVEKEPCKRERCSSSLQSRESKTVPLKPVAGNTDLGTGNFDRYSATRRTRRYKKIADLAEKDTKKEDSGSQQNFDEKPTERPSTLSLGENEQEEDAMLRVWQDKLKRSEVSTSDKIDAALAEIARSGEDLQHLSRSCVQRNSRLPVSQPPPVVAVTNTVLSPVMQESRPREPVTILAERAVTSRERHRSMIDPSQVKEAIRVTSSPPSQINQSPVRSISCEQTHDQDRKIIESNVTSIDQTDLIGAPLNIETDRKTGSNERIPAINDQPKQNSIFRNRFIPDVSVTNGSPLSLSSTGKVRDQEMNDEGFEETQSLVSESLSQETSSGHYETDAHDSTRYSPADLRYGGTIVTQCRPNDEEEETVRRIIEEPTKTVFEKRTVPVTRATSNDKSFLPKRTSNVKRDTNRKVESSKRNPTVMSANARNEVERSGSRSSLRSSRSSLNSATSVNTVRNLAPTHAHLRSYTSAIRALTNDLRKSPSNTPLPPTVKKDNDKRRVNPRIGVTRIPASRSSSSGSSIGPVRNVRKPNNAIIEAIPKVTKPRTLASRSSSSSSSIGQQSTMSCQPGLGKTAPTKSRLVQPRAGSKNHSFMRPTAASASKGSIPNLPKSIKGLVK